MLGVASDRNQARGGCSMLAAWGHACRALPVDHRWVDQRLSEPLPRVLVEAQEDWTPLRERERAIAEQRGTRPRPNSWLYYSWKVLSAPFSEHEPPVPPDPI